MSRFGVISSCSFLLSLGAGLLFAEPARADFEHAEALTRAAEKPADFEAGFEAVKACADDLEPACLYLSGIHYWNGWAVERNYEKAVANFRFAASRRHVPSQLMMGHALRLGLGTVQNLDAAMDWYERAMRSGEPEADYAWAIIHWLGVRENGVFPRRFASLSLAPPDDLANGVWGATGRYRGDRTEEPLALFPDASITIAYLQMAAEKGHQRAMAVLGRSYAVGQITEQDIGRAESLLASAAQGGDELALRSLSGLILQKEIAAPYPVPVETLLDHLAARGREGDVTAQFFLGQFYLRDDWGVQDRLQAQIWLKRAADGGVEAAGRILQALEDGGGPSGLGAPGARSVSDIREDAEAGDPAAQFRMGEIHRKGLGGTPVDFVEARSWYEQAADQGHAGALAALGTLNLYGFGQKPDVEAAMEQLREAASDDLPYAQDLLAMAEKSLAVNPDFSFQGVKILELNAIKGDVDAMAQVATYFYQGLGLVQDQEKARDLFRAAADRGNARAAYNLAQMLMLGEGGSQDVSLARDYFVKSAEGGFVLGQFWAGKFCLEARGGEQDVEKALAFFGEAADQGYAAAMNALGVIYEAGSGVDPSFRQAADWYQKAAEHGHLGAQLRLASILAEGKSGVPRDLALSYFWFMVAQPNVGDQDRRQAVAQTMSAIEQQLQPELVRQVRENAQQWQPERAELSGEGE